MGYVSQARFLSFVLNLFVTLQLPNVNKHRGKNWIACALWLIQNSRRYTFVLVWEFRLEKRRVPCVSTLIRCFRTFPSKDLVPAVPRPIEARREQHALLSPLFSNRESNAPTPPALLTQTHRIHNMLYDMCSVMVLIVTSWMIAYAHVSCTIAGNMLGASADALDSFTTNYSWSPTPDDRRRLAIDWLENQAPSQE